MTDATNLQSYVKALEDELSELPKEVKWYLRDKLATDMRGDAPQGGAIIRCAVIPKADLDHFGQALQKELLRLADANQFDLVHRAEDLVLVPRF